VVALEVGQEVVAPDTVDVRFLERLPSSWIGWIESFAAVVLLVWPVPALKASDGPAELTSIKHSVIASYAALVHASYADALAGARSLAEAADAFVDAPDADSLNRARQAWIDARVPYAQTEAYRFYDGPIDAVEGLINSWPVDENLIDYVDGEPDAGIINHPETFLAITSDLIVSLNERGGEKNITTGFHTVEFLLWGQDLYDDGPGQRSYLDYVDGHAPHASRRREYLRISARLLARHLETVVEEWAPNSASNYRARVLAMPPDDALACILKGAGILSGAELAGERLTVPYETKEQEDEHSCFSDTTHRDIIYAALGIENVFLGRYVRANGERVEGAGLRDLLARIDPALADTLRQQIETSIAASRALPAPFDRAIQGTDAAPGRVAVKRVIAALRAQADSIAQAGAALGLKLNF
jgi:putative iron-regulated protein